MTTSIHIKSKSQLFIIGHFVMLIAGLITTTTRKLDREQQSEHFLEVQKTWQTFKMLFFHPATSHN